MQTRNIIFIFSFHCFDCYISKIKHMLALNTTIEYAITFHYLYFISFHFSRHFIVCLHIWKWQTANKVQLHVHHRVCGVCVFMAGKICISLWCDHWRFAAKHHTNGKYLISCCVQAKNKQQKLIEIHTLVWGSKSQAICRANWFFFVCLFVWRKRLNEKFHFFGC